MHWHSYVCYIFQKFNKDESEPERSPELVWIVVLVAALKWRRAGFRRPESPFHVNVEQGISFLRQIPVS